MAVKFEIEEKIAELSDSRDREGFMLELNRVSWNGRKAKYDIRPWDEVHEICKKGITLDDEQMKKLVSTMKDKI